MPRPVVPIWPCRAGLFLGLIQGAVGRGDQVGGVRDAQPLGLQLHPGWLQRLHLLEQRGGIDDHAVAQHADGVGMDDAGRDQVQLEGLPGPR